jgi:hypothetical protein
MPHKTPDEKLLVYILICAFFMFAVYIVFRNVAYGMFGGGFIGGIIAYYLLEFDQSGGSQP